MNETLTTLNTRRSIRRYRPEQVRPETLDAILEAGTYAPSAMGKQSAVMAVVQDPETIALLSRLNAEIQGRPGTDPFYGAPTVVVVLADGETYNWMRDGSLVMGNLMNAAWSLGVGSCWINQLYRTREDREVQEKLAEIGVTPEEMPVAALALGWPAVDFPGPREKTGNLVSWVR